MGLLKRVGGDVLFGRDTFAQSGRCVTAGLKKDNVKLKRSVSVLKRHMVAMGKRVLLMAITLEKCRPPAGPDVTPEKKMRLTTQTIRAMRLKLSQADFGKLVGVSGQSLYQSPNRAAMPNHPTPAV